jgi:prepilin-type N-terminal cleavage/methylation domain-containing protein
MKTSDRKCADAGFTLPEVLVAFAVLTVSLAVLMPSFSTGLKGVDRSTFYGVAIADARSLLDRIGTEVPLVEAEWSGVAASGNEWTIRMQRMEPARPRQLRWDDKPPIAIPFAVEVGVFNSTGQEVALKTMRLAAAEEQEAR